MRVGASERNAMGRRRRTVAKKAADETPRQTRKAALEELAAARSGVARGEDSLSRRRSTLIDSSASEGSVRSESSGDSVEEARRQASRRKRRGVGARKGAHANETKKFIMPGYFGTERQQDEYSGSDLDDFLAPDDESFEEEGDGEEAGARRGESDRSEGSEGGDETKGAGKKKKKVRRVVDSESESESESDGDVAVEATDEKKRRKGKGKRRKKKTSKGKRRVEEEEESEEWDLTGASVQVEKKPGKEDAERHLRERKSIRDQHGGMSPLERIKKAQRRTLGLEDSDSDGDDGDDGEGDEVVDLVEPKGVQKKEKTKKGEPKPKKMKPAEVPSQPAAAPSPTGSAATSSTATRSRSGSEASTVTRSSGSSSTSSSSSSSSSSGDDDEDGSVDSELEALERRQVRELMLNEAREMSHMGEEEAFRAYMELLFCSSIDPGYESKVRTSEAHTTHYQTAKSKIEFLIITAQQYVHSQAWVNCNPHLLEAVEQYSRFEIRKKVVKHKAKHAHEGGLDDEEVVNCAACNKFGGHLGDAMINLKFLGRRRENAIICPGESKLGEGMRLSHEYLIASPVYQQNRGLWGKGDRPEFAEEALKNKKPPRSFYLGYVCVRRITMFHALLHFRRHCIIFLTRRAKFALEREPNLSVEEVVDRALSDEAHELMYRCFRNMIEIARTMQLSTGREAQYAVSKHGAFKTKAPQEVLLGDEGSECSSLNLGGEEDVEAEEASGGAESG